MINYKDLMIGDWVYSSERTKFPMRVVNVGEDYCYLDFEGNEADPIDGIDKYMMPIEVTEELLLKNRFKKSASIIDGQNDYKACINGCFVEIAYYASNIDGRNWYCHIDNDCYETIGGFDFQYLHELQNGIRLITKSDLEIKEL